MKLIQITAILAMCIPASQAMSTEVFGNIELGSSQLNGDEFSESLTTFGGNVSVNTVKNFVFSGGIAVGGGKGEFDDVDDESDISTLKLRTQMGYLNQETGGVMLLVGHRNYTEEQEDEFDDYEFDADVTTFGIRGQVNAPQFVGTATIAKNEYSVKGSFGNPDLYTTLYSLKAQLFPVPNVAPYLSFDRVNFKGDFGDDSETFIGIGIEGQVATRLGLKAGYLRGDDYDEFRFGVSLNFGQGSLQAQRASGLLTHDSSSWAAFFGVD